MKKVSYLIFITIFSLALFKAVLAAGLTERLTGYILLQTESNGEAWYLNTTDKLRYYLGRPKDAFDIMRFLGTGITNNDLEKMPIGLLENNNQDTDGDGLSDDLEIAINTNPQNADSDQDGYSDKEEIENEYNPLGQGASNFDITFIRDNQGKIFLQVENLGQAWYVNPANQKRYYLGRPIDAFNIMRFLSLGISNQDINQITTGAIQPAEVAPTPNQPYVPPYTPPISSSETSSIISEAASAIRSGNVSSVLKYFTDEVKPAAEYTLNFLGDDGRLTLGNILSGSTLASANSSSAVYTNEVDFSLDGSKVTINFIIKKQPNGEWLLANL